MELVTRSEARGRVLVSFGGGREAGDWAGEGGGGGGERASWAAASSHAARAEGSIGHAGGGGKIGGGWDWLEELFPIVVVGDVAVGEDGEGDQIGNLPSPKPRFGRGELPTSTETEREDLRRCSVNWNISSSNV